MVYADKAHTALGKRLQRQRMTAGVAAIIVMGGWGIASGSAQAQPPPATPNSAPVTSPTYKIAVEDILQIEVVDRPELTKVIQVLNDGTINYPYAGQINVVGMTISSLQSKIRAAIAKQFVNPQVVISVQRKAERQITVLGEVKAPGKHILRNDNYRVLDALADSGGLTGDRPEFFNAQLTRVKAGEVLTVDLGKLLNGNDADQNYKMEQDDVLYITSKEAATVQVQVVGQMTRPGPLVLPRSGSLVEVLQLTGPPLPNAALSQARIERGGANIPLDLRDFYRTGKLETTEKLEPGDRLVIPENKKIVKVVGAAGRTGDIPYPDDKKLTVYDVFTLTGGQTSGVDLKSTKLIRENEDGTMQPAITVDVQKMVKAGDFSDDKPVAPGDTVVFKQSAARKGLSVFEVIGLITGAATVYSIFFRR